MKLIRTCLIALSCVLLGIQCSNPSTPPRLCIIAVSVNALSSDTVPIRGIMIDLLQTNETKLTDSTGIAAFEVNPGAYTVRVHNLQAGGPVLRTVDSTISVEAGQIDTLRFFDCLQCV